MEEKKSIRKESFLICITWITYFTVYLGRLNISACISDMVADLDVTKESIGIVISAFFLAYGMGQVLSGILGDYISPILLVFLGVLGSGAANSILGCLSSISWMTVIWSVNGLFQAFIWGPMARFITELSSPGMSARICLLLSTTGPAGMLCAYGYSAVCLKYLSWRYCFGGVGVWTLVSAMFWLIGCQIMTRDCKIPLIICKEDGRKRDEGIKEFWRLLIQSGLAGIIIISCIHGILKDGISTWIPTYLADSFHISSVVSVMMTMVLPVVNLIGVFWADNWNRRWFHTEVKTIAVFFGLAFVTLLCMMAWGDNKAVFSLAFLGVITTVMTGINTLIISLIPLHFKKCGKISTVIGILNMAAYAGTTIASYGFGWIADRWGWGTLRIGWCVCAAAGCIVSLIGWRKWDSFRAEW